MILIAVSRPVHQSAPTTGLSVKGNAAGGDAAITADRFQSITAMGASVAAHPSHSPRSRDRPFHHTISYSTITGRIATALSFENTPMVVTAVSPASQNA